MTNIAVKMFNFYKFNKNVTFKEEKKKGNATNVLNAIISILHIPQINLYNINNLFKLPQINHYSFFLNNTF